LSVILGRPWQLTARQAAKTVNKKDREHICNRNVEVSAECKCITREFSAVRDLEVERTMCAVC